MFDTKQDAEIHLKTEGVWSYHFRNKTKDGEKHYYRCNMAKKRSKQQCDAGVYILVHNDSEKASVFATTEGHSHENFAELSIRLSNDIKAEIKALYESNVPLKKMYQILLEKGFMVKNKTQIYNYLTTLKKEIYGSTKTRLGQ